MGIASAAILTANWLQYEKSLSSLVGISSVAGDIGIGKRVDSIGVLTSATAIAVPISYGDIPLSMSSANGRFTMFNDYGSPEPAQTIYMYAVGYSGEASFLVSGLNGPVVWALPATPMMGAYPSGTVVETPNIASILNAVTGGSWGPGDQVLLIFRSAVTETYGTNARAMKRLATSFTLDYTV